jgi:hypothetical protein
MPAGPSDENDKHAPGQITDQIAKESSSKTESTASSHPAHNEPGPQGSTGSRGSEHAGKVEFKNASSANPGPVLPQDFKVQEEGTKEKRRKRAEEMNKPSV